MKARVFHILPVLVPGLMIPLSAQDFEGTVEYRQLSIEGSAVRELLGMDIGGDDPVDPDRAFGITVDDAVRLAERGEGAESENATYSFKGSRARFEADDGYAIMDIASGTLRMVDPDQRVYMEMSLEQLAAMSQGAQSAMREPTDDPAPGPVRPLGLTETIHGARTTAYEVRVGNEVTRAWVTDEHRELVSSVRAILDLSAQMGDEGEAAAMESLVQHGFPMRMVTVDVETGDLQIEEFMAVRPGSLPDSQFEVPAGYTKQTIPGM